MNRIKILALSMLAMAVVFSSCKKDDDDDPITPVAGPGLTVDPGSVTGWVGDAVSLNYTISTATSNEIISIDITTSESEITEVFLEGDDLDDNAVNNFFDFTMPAGPAGATWEDGDFFTVTFIATHEVNGAQYTSTKSVTCTYDSPATPMTDENVGQLNHILDGDTQGAYDLVLNVTVGAGADGDTKDMIHVTDGESDTFNPVWTVGSGNATDYVLATGIDYDNVTVEDAAAAYGDGSTAITDVTFAEGDIYVANLRGGTEGYAVIRIDEINIVPVTNDDHMIFSYKK